MRERLPVTTAARTLADLSRVVSPALLAEAVDDVLTRRLASLENIEPVTTVLAHVLAAWDGEGQPDSGAEMRLVRALRDARPPPPVRHGGGGPRHTRQRTEPRNAAAALLLRRVP